MRALSGAPRGGRAACAGAGACQGSCDGTVAERCSFPGAAIECSPATCTSGIAHPAANCDGAGACRAGEDESCGAYACGESACLTACASDADCASAELRCEGVACVPKAVQLEEGCGCASADASPMLALVGLALAFARRRR